MDLTSLTSNSLEKMSKTLAVAKFQADENESIIKDGSWSNVPPARLTGPSSGNRMNNSYGERYIVSN